MRWQYGLASSRYFSFVRQLQRLSGRWILVVALIAGWVIGLVVPVSEAAIMLTMAFIGGGVILNVMKEELPEERKSRYWSFILGAGAYSILLLSL